MVNPVRNFVEHRVNGVATVACHDANLPVDVTEPDGPLGSHRGSGVDTGIGTGNDFNPAAMRKPEEAERNCIDRRFDGPEILWMWPPAADRHRGHHGPLRDV